MGWSASNNIANAFVALTTKKSTVRLQRDKIRSQAISDPFLNHKIRMVVRTAMQAFESSLVGDRLALITAFHEVRYCGIESKSLRIACDREQIEPDSHECSETRTRNDAINESHFLSLQSRRKTAATTLINHSSQTRVRHRPASKSQWNYLSVILIKIGRLSKSRI